MTQTIIDTYNVRLINKTIQFPIRGKIVQKIIEVNNTYLAELLNSLENPQDITDYLITDIDQALASASSEIEGGSETIEVVIFQTKVDLYNDSGFVYTIPTSDFKEIVVGWRDFLLTSPLNGTKV